VAVQHHGGGGSSTFAARRGCDWIYRLTGATTRLCGLTALVCRRVPGLLRRPRYSQLGVPADDTLTSAATPNILIGGAEAPYTLPRGRRRHLIEAGTRG